MSAHCERCPFLVPDGTVLCMHAVCSAIILHACMQLRLSPVGTGTAVSLLHQRCFNAAACVARQSRLDCLLARSSCSPILTPCDKGYLAMPRHARAVYQFTTVTAHSCGASLLLHVFGPLCPGCLTAAFASCDRQTLLHACYLVTPTL